MPSDTSSVIVLPINVAPASSKCCTAQACRVGTGFDRAQSGLPPPVGNPATSNRSLAAKVSPESGPSSRPSMWTRGPGTKALMSSGIENPGISSLGESSLLVGQILVGQILVDQMAVAGLGHAVPADGARKGED